VLAAPQMVARFVLLLLLVPAPARALGSPADPLSCFGEPLTGEAKNICSGSYKQQFHEVASAAACADKCLADAACVQFVFANDNEQPNCRLSATCTVPKTASAGWDGYLRHGTHGPCASPAPPPLSFHSAIFQPGMVLQRGSPGTKVWGGSLHTSGTVKVTVIDDEDGSVLSTGSGVIGANRTWVVALDTAVPARHSTTLSATLGDIPAATSRAAAAVELHGVAFGDVLLCGGCNRRAPLCSLFSALCCCCLRYLALTLVFRHAGGQSNMAFGTCGANSPAQSPNETLASLPGDGNPIRFYFQQGSIGGGAAASEGSIQCESSKPPSGNPWCNVSGNACHSIVTSSTPTLQWFNASATNAGSASAVCLLTAQRLHAALGGRVPVGAVESCVGGTAVEPWTPPSGELYVAHIEPLLPMRFAAALWDQGEADAKRSNSTWYTHEFPTMIAGWREAFDTTALPFIYVELCTEYAAQEPKEGSFYNAQRSALTLPATGFATTTDIQRALHPPNKQAVADRLVLEVLRLAGPEELRNTIARGPELLKASFAGGAELTLTFSNSSLHTGAGVQVPPPVGGCGLKAKAGESVFRSSAVMQQVGDKRVEIPFTIRGAELVATCTPGNTSTPVLVNADSATCFLYGPSAGAVGSLPAPPLSLPCAAQ
jgi:hypothetical protein